jgi:hypothetical protein
MAAVSLTWGLALAQSGRAEGSMTPPVPFEHRALKAGVFDASTGAPIVGATVIVVGHNLSACTDEHGYVEFQHLPRARIYRVWTYPDGYTPGANQAPVTGTYLWTSIFVLPQDLYSTGLIAKEVGGSFTFAGTVQGATAPSPFWMRLDVPPGALDEDFMIGVTPRPTFADVPNALPDDTLTLGQWHVTLRNSAGEQLAKALALPVIFNIRPWSFADSSLEDPQDYPDGMFGYCIYRYDYALNQFVDQSIPVAIDSLSSALSFPVQSFSFFTAKKHGYGLWASVGAPPPPPVPPAPPWPTIEESYECETVCWNPIQCGIYGMECSFKIEKGTSVQVTAGLKAALEAQYSVEGTASLAVATAKVSQQVGLSLEASLTGQYTSTTTEEVAGKIPAGASGLSHCLSGLAQLQKVFKVYHIKVGTTELGTIKKPVGPAVTRSVSNDASCGVDCETPSPSTIDNTPCPN